MDSLNLFARQRQRTHIAKQRDRLYRIAFSWCHDAMLADDLVQDCMAKAFKNLHSLRNQEAIETWLFTILNNCWRDYIRRQKETEQVDENSITHEFTPERAHDEYQIMSRVRRAVDQLSQNQRQVITLVDLEGLSYAQVAEVLAIPIGTVMSRLCRARNTMKDLLNDNNRAEVPARIRRVK